jgi:putative hydrolase of the HAD superfamily
MISTVTFDFWETLVHDTAENLARQRGLRVAALRLALERAGEAVDESEVAGAHDRSLDVLIERFWGHHRDLDSREQVRIVLDCARPGVADRLPPGVMDELIEGYISPVLTHPPGLQPGAAEAVRGLAARGIRLGIISNTGRTPGVVLRRLLAAHDLLRHFAVISYSDEVRVRKPDPEIFHRTLLGAGAAAREAAHVGDNPVDDVQGARTVGMLAVHYTAGGRAGAAQADLVIDDLAALPERLLSGP